MGYKFKLFPVKYGLLPYVYLVYLMFPIIVLINETGIKAVVGWMLLCLFFLSYRKLYFDPPMSIYMGWLIIQFIIIIIFTYFYQPSLVLLGFYCANFIGWLRNSKMFAISMILFVFSSVFPIILQYEMLSEHFYLVVMVVVMFLSPFGIHSMSTKMELEEKLNEANEQIEVLIKREERMRIARDLHDTLGHTLSYITLKSQLVAKMTKHQADPQIVTKEVKEIERTSRNALKQVRELVADMRILTIAETISDCKGILNSANITLEVTGLTRCDNITSMTQNIISMCIKEGVTNIVKHSRATHCVIGFSQNNLGIEVTIRDNGVGFNRETKLGNGLKGMSERLEFVEGSLNFFHYDRGLSVNVFIPIVERKFGGT
ncbi:sensor histidine kinase [Cytobacillus sp. FSL K6-0265]|uniref:sensor histidine kinase n=1 Tax=Cytobacillus sp. FSL K6-0265 TaxID=2921448 RepID=UPI0030FC8363